MSVSEAEVVAGRFEREEALREREQKGEARPEKQESTKKSRLELSFSQELGSTVRVERVGRSLRQRTLLR